MTIDQAIVIAKKSVHSEHAKIILADILNMNTLELLLYLDKELTKEEEKLYLNKIEKLRLKKPLQYILKNINFYGNIFYINENVLIPRYETERLIEIVVDKSKKLFTKPVDIIDLGTGSGVIGITLEKKLSTKSVDLIDISPKALEIAKINVEKLNSSAKIIESDMFEKINRKYDIIISNPPYIKTTEEVEEEVKNNEPHIALYAGEDGLDAYKKIIKNIKKHLKEQTLIAFEIGQTQAEEIKKLLEEELKNIEVEIKKDLQEKIRYIIAIYKEKTLIK